MHKKQIAVIGLGEFGVVLVRCLHREGHEVVAIDKNMEIVNGIAEHSTRAVCLDSTDEKAMRMQAMEEMDAVIIASADNLEMVIVTVDILKRVGAKRIIARYKNELQIRILNMLGITTVFNPEERAALNMAEQFSHLHMRTSTVLTDRYRIAEVDAPKVLVGKKLSESKLKEQYRLLLVTIRRATDVRSPREELIGIPMLDTTIQEGDILILFGSHEDLEKFLERTD